MPSRLSLALRELAAALDDAEWDVVGSTATSPPASPKGKGAARAHEPTLASSSAAGSGASVTGPKARAAATRAPAQSRPTPTSPTKEAQQEVSGSTVAYRQDWRIYVVIANPQQPERVGVAQGPGADTWRRLEKTLPGGRLSGSAVRLRRVESLRTRTVALERSTPRPGDAGAGDLKGAAEAIMTAVGSAADQLGTAEVDAGRTAAEILGDEASRASAARWRSGSVHRRLTATLARLMTSLQQWTSLAPAAPPPGYPGASATTASTSGSCQLSDGADFSPRSVAVGQCQP